MCQSTRRASLPNAALIYIMSINRTKELVNCDRIVYTSLTWDLGGWDQCVATASATLSPLPFQQLHLSHILSITAVTLTFVIHTLPSFHPLIHQLFQLLSFIFHIYMYISSPNVQHPPPLHLYTSCIFFLPSPNHVIFWSQPPTLLFLLSVSPITSSSSTLHHRLSWRICCMQRYKEMQWNTAYKCLVRICCHFVLLLVYVHGHGGGNC